MRCNGGSRQGPPTQLLGAIHDFTIEKCGQIDATFLDLSEAFTRVSQHKLTHKVLISLAFGLVRNCVNDYLTNRYQFVCN